MKDKSSLHQFDKEANNSGSISKRGEDRTKITNETKSRAQKKGKKEAEEKLNKKKKGEQWRPLNNSKAWGIVLINELLIDKDED